MKCFENISDFGKGNKEKQDYRGLNPKTPCRLKKIPKKKKQDI